LVLLLVLESVIPQYKGRKHRVKHNAANIFIGVFNSLIIQILIAALLLMVTVWATENNFGLLNWLSVTGWLHWVLAIILFDFWQYTWHWMNHKIPFFWRFHRVHHTDEELDVTSAVRFHPGEIILSSIFRMAIIPLIGMTFDQLVLYEVILLPIILFHHSNVGIPEPLDRCFRWLIVTPWMHWVHHSNIQTETDSNYCSLLSVWDRIFRTFKMRTDPDKIHLGLKNTPEFTWRHLGGMFVHPFTKTKAR